MSISELYHRSIENQRYDMICWRHTEDGGFIDNVSENRLINHDFRKWITNLSVSKSVPQWKLATIKIGSRKWQLLFMYTDVDMQIDPLYKWMLGKTAGQMNTRGNAYLFKRKSIRTACLHVFTHMIGVSSGGVYTMVPRLTFVHTTVEDGPNVQCICGGIYTSTKCRSHIRTSQHISWMNECVELLQDD